MLPNEMHIAIDESLQYVNSSLYDTILPEEKDWFLNETCIRFIRDSISIKANRKKEGFDDTIERYEGLEELVTDSGLTMYVHPSEINCMRSYMPNNFFTLINDRSVINWNCNGISLVKTTPASTIKYCIAPFPLVSVDIYARYKLEIWNTVGGGSTLATLFDMNDATGLLNDNLKIIYPTGLPALSYKFIIINQLLYRCARETSVNTYCSVYWEKFENIYAQNSFIVIINTPLSTYQLRQFDNGAATAGSPYAQNTITKDTYVVPTIYTQKTIPNRITDHEIVHNALNSYYFKTNDESPISTMNRGFLNVYHNTTFYPVTLNIQYIRKPRSINYAINQSCEINPNFHQNIVDITVQRIKALVQAGNYKEFVNENLSVK